MDNSASFNLNCYITTTERLSTSNSLPIIFFNLQWPPPNLTDSCSVLYTVYFVSNWENLSNSFINTVIQQSFLMKSFFQIHKAKIELLSFLELLFFLEYKWFSHMLFIINCASTVKLVYHLLNCNFQSLCNSRNLRYSINSVLLFGCIACT